SAAGPSHAAQPAQAGHGTSSPPRASNGVRRVVSEGPQTLMPKVQGKVQGKGTPSSSGAGGGTGKQPQKGSGSGNSSKDRGGKSAKPKVSLSPEEIAQRKADAAARAAAKAAKQPPPAVDPHAAAKAK